MYSGATIFDRIMLFFSYYYKSLKLSRHANVINVVNFYLYFEEFGIAINYKRNNDF